MEKCSLKKCSCRDSSSESTSLYETDRCCKNIERKRKISCKLSRRIRNRRNLAAMLVGSPNSTSDESDSEFIPGQTSSPSSSSASSTSSSSYNTTAGEICSDYSSGSFVTSADTRTTSFSSPSTSSVSSSGSSSSFKTSGSSSSSERTMSTQEESYSSNSFTDAEPEFSSFYNSISSDDDDEE